MAANQSNGLPPTLVTSEIGSIRSSRTFNSETVSIPRLEGGGTTEADPNDVGKLLIDYLEGEGWPLSVLATHRKTRVRRIQRAATSGKASSVALTALVSHVKRRHRHPHGRRRRTLRAPPSGMAGARPQ